MTLEGVSGQARRMSLWAAHHLVVCQEEIQTKEQPKKCPQSNIGKSLIDFPR